MTRNLEIQEWISLHQTESPETLSCEGSGDINSSFCERSVASEPSTTSSDRSHGRSSPCLSGSTQETLYCTLPFVAYYRNRPGQPYQWSHIGYKRVKVLKAPRSLLSHQSVEHLQSSYFSACQRSTCLVLQTGEYAMAWSVRDRNRKTVKAFRMVGSGYEKQRHIKPVLEGVQEEGLATVDFQNWLVTFEQTRSDKFAYFSGLDNIMALGMSFPVSFADLQVANFLDVWGNNLEETLKSNVYLMQTDGEITCKYSHESQRWEEAESPHTFAHYDDGDYVEVNLQDELALADSLASDFQHPSWHTPDPASQNLQDTWNISDSDNDVRMRSEGGLDGRQGEFRFHTEDWRSSLESGLQSPEVEIGLTSCEGYNEEATGIMLDLTEHSTFSPFKSRSPKSKEGSVCDVDTEYDPFDLSGFDLRPKNLDLGLTFPSVDSLSEECKLPQHGPAEAKERKSIELLAAELNRILMGEV